MGYDVMQVVRRAPRRYGDLAIVMATLELERLAHAELLIAFAIGTRRRDSTQCRRERLSEAAKHGLNGGRSGSEC